jgi:hypothetical protein
MRSVGLVRNVMPVRKGLHRDVLLVPGDGSWPVPSGGRQCHRTTSIGAMPSSAGRSKPHTCA